MATRLTYQAFDRLPHALFRLPHTRLTLHLAAVVSGALLLTACPDDPTSEPPIRRATRFTPTRTPSSCNLACTRGDP